MKKWWRHPETFPISLYAVGNGGLHKQMQHFTIFLVVRPAQGLEKKKKMNHTTQLHNF